MPSVVSVCILTYNSAAFIAEAVHSATKQTLQDLEIVIVDNGSTDATVEICNQFRDKDPRISIHINEIPLGISGGLNRCLELASGEYIKILMHDDVLEPACLERMVAIFKQFPTVKLVGCSEQIMTEEGKPIRSLTPYTESGLVPGHKVTKRMLLNMSNDIGTPTSVLMKRGSYGSGFNRSLYLFLDIEMWCRALLEGDYYFLNEPLSKLRVHAQTGSTINSKTLLFLSDILKLKDMYADFMEEEGFSKEEWTRIVDKQMLAHAGYVLFEEGLTVEEVRAYVHKLRAMVGYDYTEQLLESLALVIFYAFSRLFKTDLELRWSENEIQNLTNKIDLMSKSLPWKMARPLRDLRSRLFR